MLSGISRFLPKPRLTIFMTSRKWLFMSDLEAATGARVVLPSQNITLDSRLTQGKPLPCSRPQIKKTRRTRVVLFGGGQTRTDELRRGGIYSPLQLPLCDTPVRKKCVESKGCWRKDLNPQPSAYKADALPLSYTSI